MEATESTQGDMPLNRAASQLLIHSPAAAGELSEAALLPEPVALLPEPAAQLQTAAPTDTTTAAAAAAAAAPPPPPPPVTAAAEDPTNGGACICSCIQQQRLCDCLDTCPHTCQHVTASCSMHPCCTRCTQSAVLCSTVWPNAHALVMHAVQIQNPNPCVNPMNHHVNSVKAACLLLQKPACRHMDCRASDQSNETTWVCHRQGCTWGADSFACSRSGSFAQAQAWQAETHVHRP